MQIQMMKLSEIHPYEKNPRFNDGAVEAVASPELSQKRVPGHHQRAMTRKTGQRRGGAIKRGGGAFLDSCCLKSIVVYQEFPGRDYFDSVVQNLLVVPSDNKAL